MYKECSLLPSRNILLQWGGTLHDVEGNGYEKDQVLR